MMRSLFSGVAGLRTHQTKMDVIGNNIANVNTTAYKSQSTTFRDLMYQTTQAASGANIEAGNVGIGGVNARQIGLGVQVGAINTNIGGQGSAQNTGNAFDIMITGDAFFIVSNGSENFFTRDGSFYIDGEGNLAMTSNGYKVMGWQVDPETGDPKPDTVTPLEIMKDEFMTYKSAATTDARVTGIVDKNDKSVKSTSGRIMNLEFYDQKGFLYTAKLSIHDTGTEGRYYVTLDKILDSGTGKPIEEDLSLIDFGGTMDVKTSISKSCSSTPVLDGTLKFQLGAVTKEITIGRVGTGGTIEPAAASLAEAGITGDLATMYKDLDPTGITAAYVDAQGRLHVTEPTNLAKVYMLKSEVVTTPTITTATINGVSFPTGEYTVNAGTITAPGGTGGTTITPEQISAAFNGYDPTSDGTKTFVIGNDGSITVTEKTVEKSVSLVFNSETGMFDSVDGNTEGFVTLGLSGANGKFADISIDFSTTKNVNNGGSSTVGASKGTSQGLGSGRKTGEMISISIAKSGIITASYDNGMSRCLGQIATATFANASGLEKQGDNLYSATMNSGEFDGIGKNIEEGGGYMQSGVLEMSNVDLSQEFTEMITTQRGFQANSRIITVSDSLLEELTNLKR